RGPRGRAYSEPLSAVILVWLFALLVGLTGFMYALFVLHMGPFFAVVYALVAMLVVRGLFTYVKRWLILSERLAEEKDQDVRTVETNRYIFWRRVFGLAILLGLYFGGAAMFAGLSPADALIILPNLLVQMLLLVAQL